MAVSNYDHHRSHYGPGTAYDEPPARISGLVKTVIGTVAVLGIAAFAWVVWIAYDETMRSDAVKTVPVIKADAGGIKRKPDDPGGMVVPHQDKLVFSRLAPGEPAEPVERLLAQPEAPLPVREAIVSEAEKTLGAGEAVQSQSEDQTEVATALTPSLVESAPVEKLPMKDESTDGAGASAAQPTVDPAEIIAKTPPAAATPLDRPAEARSAPPPPPVIAREAAASPAPPPATTTAAAMTAVGEAWRIQLVSLGSQQDAEATWARLQKSNPDLLGELKLHVQSAQLAKGTFYRLQAGPLSDRAAAAALCSSLKSRKQDCLVVAP